MHRLITLLVLLAAPRATLPAQAADRLTPERAVALGRAHGPLAAHAAARRLVHDGRARTDGAWPNPIAEWRVENLDAPIARDRFATIQLPVDVTGRRVALRQAAGLARDRGRADSAATLRAFDAEVLRAYWRVMLAVELAQIAMTERDARVETATFETGRFREGAVAEVSAMRTQLEADRARVVGASAEAEATRARADLARLIGVATPELPALPALEDVPIDSSASDTSWSLVRERRPELHTTRLAAAESERRWRAETRGLVGDLGFVGGYKGTGGFATGILGVQVPLPLFNRNDGPRLRSQGEFLAARADLLDAELRARAEVHAAALAWAGVRDAGRAGAATLDDRASEIARIAEASYREGAISLVDLLEAQRARADARAAAARWLVDVHLARLELDRATGAPLLR
ncbi:MAG: TolC family protein [Gemmatimonadaceae bacterium]|nr:TolC family protein [Gemmatimonadaceae bacterium]